LDGKMVPDLPAIPADLSAAHAVGADRMRAHDPVGHIEVVDVLLADLIAAQPDVVIPVVDLILDIAHARLARARPDAGAVPVNAHVQYIADHAVVNLVDGVDVVDLVAALRATDDGQLLLLGLLGSLHHRAQTG